MNKLLGFIILAMIVSALHMSTLMVREGKMLLCYNTGGLGMGIPYLDFKCTFVPRGKGW